jgi:hypothetical protein
MNLNDLQRKLMAAARAHPPADAVPYAFEKRITHCLKGLGKVDYWAFWSRALWRAAAPCVAVALVLVVLSFLNGPGTSSSPDLSQELENTVLAAASVDQPSADPLR